MGCAGTVVGIHPGIRFAASVDRAGRDSGNERALVACAQVRDRLRGDYQVVTIARVVTVGELDAASEARRCDHCGGR
jgi:hypothetical protein